jgi:hypothetical protein
LNTGESLLRRIFIWKSGRDIRKGVGRGSKKVGYGRFELVDIENDDSSRRFIPW